MSDDIKVIVSNRKARYEYRIDQTYEAGISLVGTEVKSLREGKANLQDAFCSMQQGNLMLLNCHIAPYRMGTDSNHEPLRPRQLLLHRKELEKLDKGVQRKGATIIPLKLYFKKGRAKVEVGLAFGKKLYDKRADIADRESKRRMQRASRDHES